MSIFSHFDLHLFHEGTHQRLFDKFGAHVQTRDGRAGVHFALWAPNARYVSVIGDFNEWNQRVHALAQHVDPAIWEGFVEGAKPGQLYKFYVESGEYAGDRADPFAFCAERPPGDASVICDPKHTWHEGTWPHHKRAANSLESPISICAGDPDSAKEMGFTHVLLPQAGRFSPPGELTPAEYMTWIERLHQRGLGAVLDFSSCVSEIVGREVQAIEISAAVYWMEHYHVDLLIGRDLFADEGWRDQLYEYLAVDPIQRRDHHDKLVRRMEWAFRENFVLPVREPPTSIPGDDWQQRATLRLLLSWLFAMPGKKLMAPMKDGAAALLTGQLNHLYRTSPALYTSDHFHEGFSWIEAANAEYNLATFVRRQRDGDDVLLYIGNFSPVPRQNYRVGVPARGVWREVLNTDATEYGGTGHGNFGAVETVPIPLHEQRHSITVTVPPLAGVFFRLEH